MSQTENNNNNNNNNNSIDSRENDIAELLKKLPSIKVDSTAFDTKADSFFNNLLASSLEEAKEMRRGATPSENILPFDDPVMLPLSTQFPSLFSFKSSSFCPSSPEESLNCDDVTEENSPIDNSTTTMRNHGLFVQASLIPSNQQRLDNVNYFENRFFLQSQPSSTKNDEEQDEQETVDLPLLQCVVGSRSCPIIF